MTKSATDVMQEIVFAAVVDSIVALKAAAGGLPNTLLRELNAIHPNTTFADLPPEIQKAVAASVRAGFSRLLKEGYSVAPAGSETRRAPAVGRESHGSGPGPRGRGRGDKPGGGPGGRPAGRRKPSRRPGS